MAFTFFFRDNQTLEQLADLFVEFVSGRSSVKIWNPGCASGQEPFTFIIMLAERMNRFAFRNLKVHATDIDISTQFQKIIENGIYHKDELQRIPKELFNKYFQAISETHCQIDQNLRAAITYKQADLTKLQPMDGNYSLVLCKNVLLHLSPQSRVEVIKMFYEVLTPGGLFATEQTQELPHGMEKYFQKIVPNAQIYRRI